MGGDEKEHDAIQIKYIHSLRTRASAYTERVWRGHEGMDENHTMRIQLREARVLGLDMRVSERQGEAETETKRDRHRDRRRESGFWLERAQ